MPRAPAALLEAARLAERDGDCRTAATEYLDLARLYPAAAEAGEALLRGGVCQYRLGQTASAAESWQRLIDGYPTNTYAHAGRFWAGKAALELGNGEQAVSLWQPLQREAADSYYTARAEEMAAEAGLAGADSLAIQAARPAADDDGSQEAAERWLASWAAPGVADPASLRQLPAAVAADPQLRRGEAYLAAGMRAEAIRELDEVRERYRDDPLALYALAQRFSELRLYRHATLAAIRLGALSPGGLFGAPLYVQRLAYPDHYADIVEAEAAAQGVDPLLIYALIRQESFFEQGARSSAAAQGLTQVIPSTAEWIANAMGWPNFQPGDIYKPYLNVKFGTYYLKTALDMFDGNPYPALVGYNAGTRQRALLAGRGQYQRRRPLRGGDQPGRAEAVRAPGARALRQLCAVVSRRWLMKPTYDHPYIVTETLLPGRPSRSFCQPFQESCRSLDRPIS